MPRATKYSQDAPMRVAPGTAVTWYEGVTRMSGRVMHNLPGPKGKGPTLVIKPTGGGRAVVPFRRVRLVGGEG